MLTFQFLPTFSLSYSKFTFSNLGNDSASPVSQLFSAGFPAHVMKTHLSLILNFGNRWREDVSFMTRASGPVLRHRNKKNISPLQRIEP